ncbi:MAG TPA: hypothetical protein PLN56_04320 [Methanoregulaceae archaeon]|nr:hypothetical protein [Methanoregulaceae archaeon]
MERLSCPRCGAEFYLQTGCRVCGPPLPGPHTCPECGAVLCRMIPSYYVPGGWDEE